MSVPFGILVFSRYESRRLPGKALHLLGGMPLLERVLRRAQSTGLPVYLATTNRASDDVLVALADSLGVRSFRGSSERVLDRAVLAAEFFGVEAFIRLCGDRPLFPIDDLQRAVALMTSFGQEPPDLITSYCPGVTTRGLTTELVRTPTLRAIMERGVSADQQEHVTAYLYDNPDQFRIIQIPDPPTGYACSGFALDTASDLEALNKIFEGSSAVDLTAAQADRIYCR